MTSALQSVVVVSASLLLHGLAFAAIGVVPRVRFERPETNEVNIEVVEPEAETPPEPPPEPPPPPPDPEPVREVARELPQREAPEEPPPETPPPPPAPAAEEPINFDGVTLSSEDADSSFTMNAGNGQHMEGPLRARPGTQHIEGSPNGAPGGTGTGDAAPGPRVVAVADLSRRPAPPDMSRVISAMTRFYPRDAREDGIEGHALVRMQIAPDGRLSRFRVVSGAEHGFGEACRRALVEAGNWSAPLDRNGQSVATEVSFDCDFQISSF